MTPVHTVSYIFLSRKHIFHNGQKAGLLFHQVDTISLFFMAVRKPTFYSRRRHFIFKDYYLYKCLEMVIWKNIQCFAQKVGKNARDIGRIVSQLSPVPTLCFYIILAGEKSFHTYTTLLVILIHLTGRRCGKVLSVYTLGHLVKATINRTSSRMRLTCRMDLNCAPRILDPTILAHSYH